MTPRLAVAVNLAQLVARASHSRLSLRNWSLVVPQCISELAITVAVWHTEFLTASFVCLSTSRSVWLLRMRNCRCRPMVTSPLRMVASLDSWAARPSCSSSCAGAASAVSILTGAADDDVSDFSSAPSDRPASSCGGSAEMDSVVLAAS
uniref:Uncharacterized protein n=1 Tax=Ixodes ricinus TaxID=34613 RepID=A0A6B0UUT3_IXORI